MELKINNVYEFRYKPEIAEKIFSPYHCFDGQLIAREWGDKVILQDTYWGTSSDSRRFSLDEAKEKGTLKFICNLDEVKEIDEYNLRYYADEDVFNLSSQSGYRKKYAIKKNTQRSKDKMLRVLNESLANAKHAIENAKREIQIANKKITELNDGNIDIYI
jgi:hypothetical protein